MKFLKTINGNHYFDFNGTNIIGWTVVGCEKICVSLDNYKGETLYFKGKFKKVESGGAEGMQKFLESKGGIVSEWLPKSLAVAKQRDADKLTERQAKELEAQKKVNKDRSIPLYRSIIITKGKHKISIATQPYQVGIYVAISDSKESSLIQLSLRNHRSANNQLNKIIGKFEGEGYKVLTAKQKIDYSKV